MTKMSNQEKITLLCLTIKELIHYLPDGFKPVPQRLEAIKEKMERCECLPPPEIVCSDKTGRCIILDGRHRIYAAEKLGKKTMLVKQYYQRLP